MLFDAIARRFISRPFVRPWALCAPIIILLISIPMLRPLHLTDMSLLSDDEQSRLATVQAIVEQHSLAIENTDFRETRAKIVSKADAGKLPLHVYSNQPPMLSALLSGPYWVLNKMGISLGH